MKRGDGPSGYLPINKPSGITSFDVIRELRRQLKIRKLGHSGVLDKPATGVLVVGANSATRLFELFAGYEKTYAADIWLGLATATDDTTGELTAIGEASAPELGKIEQVLAEYIGPIDQIPPSFSLTKIGGKELYRYALKGERIESSPKRVTIVAAEIADYETGVDPDRAVQPDSKLFAALDQLPALARLRVTLRCVGGVYVRSLARDIGADLGTGGTLGELVRLRVGPFGLDDCLTLGEVAERVAAGEAPRDLMLPLGSIAPEEARIRLDATQLAMVRNGRSIRRFKHHLPPTAEKSGDVIYGMDPGHDLAVILTVGTVNQHGLVELKPAKVLT